MNTDDYEGHTPGPWKYANVIGSHCVNEWAHNWNEPDARLIAAAPDLLAEVKRLRFHLQQILDEIDLDDYEHEMLEWFTTMKWMYGGEEE